MGRKIDKDESEKDGCLCCTTCACLPCCPTRWEDIKDNLGWTILMFLTIGIVFYGAFSVHDSLDSASSNIDALGGNGGSTYDNVLFIVAVCICLDVFTTMVWFCAAGETGDVLCAWCCIGSSFVVVFFHLWTLVLFISAIVSSFAFTGVCFTYAICLLLRKQCDSGIEDAAAFRSTVNKLQLDEYIFTGTIPDDYCDSLKGLSNLDGATTGLALLVMVQVFFVIVASKLPTQLIMERKLQSFRNLGSDLENRMNL